MLTPIEKAIQAANLGFNPQNDGVLIRIIVCKLDEKLVAPGGKPPVESYEELEKSGVIEQIRSKSCVFSDGAKSWKKYVLKHKKRLGLSFRSVVHTKFEFTKEVKPANNNVSAVAGTQSIDNAWKEVDKFIPKTLKSRRQSKLWDYVFAWTWRYNTLVTQGSVDWFAEIGAACNDHGK